VAAGLDVIALLLLLSSESETSRSTGMCWSVCSRGPRLLVLSADRARSRLVGSRLDMATPSLALANTRPGRDW
jgi:hypothetical protein